MSRCIGEAFGIVRHGQGSPLGAELRRSLTDLLGEFDLDHEGGADRAGEW